MNQRLHFQPRYSQRNAQNGSSISSIRRMQQPIPKSPPSYPSSISTNQRIQTSQSLNIQDCLGFIQAYEKASSMVKERGSPVKALAYPKDLVSNQNLSALSLGKSSPDRKIQDQISLLNSDSQQKLNERLKDVKFSITPYNNIDYSMQLLIFILYFERQENNSLESDNFINGNGPYNLQRSTKISIQDTSQGHYSNKSLKPLILLSYKPTSIIEIKQVDLEEFHQRNKNNKENPFVKPINNQIPENQQPQSYLQHQDMQITKRIPTFNQIQTSEDSVSPQMIRLRSEISSPGQDQILGCEDSLVAQTPFMRRPRESQRLNSQLIKNKVNIKIHSQRRSSKLYKEISKQLYQQEANHTKSINMKLMTMLKEEKKVIEQKKQINNMLEDIEKEEQDQREDNTPKSTLNLVKLLANLLVFLLIAIIGTQIFELLQ